MAGFCWTLGFFQENENPKYDDDALGELVKGLNTEKIIRLISQIEDGLNDIDEVTSEPAPDGAGSKDENSLSDFGCKLIDILWTNCDKRHASKACFLNRLKQGTQKVVTGVLGEKDNIKSVAGGLSVVAYFMKELKKTRQSRRPYRHSLLYMLGLLKHMDRQVGWELPKQKRLDTLNFIVLGSLLFKIQLKYKKHYCCGPDLNVADTQNFEFELGKTHKDLAFGSINKSFPAAVDRSQTRRINEGGIKEALDEVIRVLEPDREDKSIRAMVIEGADGIGKTAVFNAAFKSLKAGRKLLTRLDIDNFVSKPDMKILQQQILQDLFGKKVVLRSCEEGLAHLSKAFREEACWPVFIFIDNAHFDLRELLPEDEQLLPMQSRILITTSDSTRLNMPAYIDQCHYQMKPLPDAEAKKLIMQNGLVGEQAINTLTKKSAGIPLALIMLSTLLRQQVGNISAHCLVLIKQSTEDAFDICSSIVDYIYSTLEEAYKEAFLDIAVFFNNWDRRMVTHIFPDIQLNTLEERGLITISKEDRLSIHGVVKKWAMQMSGKDRITSVESFNEQKLSEVKGMWLSEGELEAADLDKMYTSLRVLYLGKSTKVKGKCIETFQNLRFFYLYNNNCLPLGLDKCTGVTYFRGRLKNNDHFYELNKLWDVLRQPSISNLPRFTKEIQLAGSLHVLDLSGCEDIVKLPKGFTCLISLEDLNLNNCTKLKSLPHSLGQLKSLYRLNLSGCSKLKAIPETLGNLSWLGELDCTDCSKLKALPSNFGQLNSLCHLQLKRCSRLVTLPESFGNLSSLEYLDLSDCTQLSKLPNTFHKLSSLSLLRVTRSSLAELPENFGNLSSLRELDLSYCEKLGSLDNLSSSKNDLPSDQTVESHDNLSSSDSQRFESPCTSKRMDLSDRQKFESPGTSFPSKETDSVPGRQKLETPPAEMVLSCGEKFKCPCNLLSLRKMDSSGSQKPESPGTGDLSTPNEMPLQGDRKPKTFGKLQTLCRLYLKDCSRLTSLSEDFSRLLHLEELDLTGCDKLASLPEHFGDFKNLIVLKLSCSRLTQLPLFIGFMISLQRMTLKDCANISRLPAGICELKSLSYLHMGSCSRLTELPFGFDKLSSLEELEITGCSHLHSLREEQPLALRVLKLRGCSELKGLQENIGNLSKLEELVLTGCASLETLPSSLSKINSLRHLRLRGASQLTSIPENLPSSIETLDLGGCSNFRLHRLGIQLYSSLKLLFIDGCSKLYDLPDNFGLLNSLSYLSIAGCTELDRLPDCLESLVNLLAVDASECPFLKGDTLDRLAKLPCLYFVDVMGSQLLIRRWEEGRKLHNQLVARLQTDEEAMYADTISCLSTETERFAVVITCSSDSQGLEEINKKRKKLEDEGFHICFIHMTDMSERCSTMKSQKLFCFAILRWLKKRKPEIFAAVEILHTWIVSVDVCTDKEGQQHIGDIKAILPAVGDGDRKDIDLQALTDIHGGVGRFFPPLLGVVADKLAQSVGYAKSDELNEFPSNFQSF